MGSYSLKVTRRPDGKIHVWLLCLRCGTWAIVDADQLHGRVSAEECAAPGCGFHETVDFFGHLTAADREKLQGGTIADD